MFSVYIIMRWGCSTFPLLSRLSVDGLSPFSGALKSRNFYPSIKRGDTTRISHLSPNAFSSMRHGGMSGGIPRKWTTYGEIFRMLGTHQTNSNPLERSCLFCSYPVIGQVRKLVGKGAHSYFRNMAFFSFYELRKYFHIPNYVLNNQNPTCVPFHKACGLFIFRGPSTWAPTRQPVYNCFHYNYFHSLV